MEQKKLKHSKLKNTGIIFELLTQKITSDILEGKVDTVAKNLIQKFFCKENILSKELKLYQFVVREKIKNSDHAYRLLETVIEARKKLSSKKLGIEKHNLIKEIKESYNLTDKDSLENFFKGNIPNYKIYASIYKLFENSVSQDIFFDPREIIDAKDTLIESLILRSTNNLNKTNDDPLMESFSSQTYGEKILTYKILVETFNKKYKILSPKQQELLRVYVNSSGTIKLKEHLEKEVVNTIVELKTYLNKISDNVTKIKLNEVIHQLSEIKIGIDIKDNYLTTLLMSYELINELGKIK
jgi:hypothetical protein